MTQENGTDELGELQQQLAQLVAKSLELEESIKAAKTKAGGVNDDTVLILGADVTPADFTKRAE